MKNLLPAVQIQIEPDNPPPSAKTVEEARATLEKLRVTVSGTTTAALGLCLVTFIAVQAFHAEWAMPIFILSLVTFLFLHYWERNVLSARLADLQPLPDDLCAEAAALSQLSEPARQYTQAVRAQKRDFIFAEFEALQRAAQSLVPKAAGRRALYGSERP